MKTILNELKALFEELLGFVYSEDIELQDSWSITQFKQTRKVNFSDFELYIDVRFSCLEHYSELVTPDIVRALNSIKYEIIEINWTASTNTAEFRLTKEQRNDVQ